MHDLLAKARKAIGLNIWLPEGEIKRAMIISHAMGEPVLRYANVYYKQLYALRRIGVITFNG